MARRATPAASSVPPTPAPSRRPPPRPATARPAPATTAPRLPARGRAAAAAWPGLLARAHEWPTRPAACPPVRARRGRSRGAHGQLRPAPPLLTVSPVSPRGTSARHNAHHSATGAPHCRCRDSWQNGEARSLVSLFAVRFPRGAAATHRQPPSTSSKRLIGRPAPPPPSTSPPSTCNSSPSHASAGRPAPPPLPDLQRGRPAPPPLADLQRFSHRGQPAPSPLADLQHLNHHGKQQLITSRWRLDPTGWSAHTRRPAAPPEHAEAWPAREKARSMAWQSWSGARADGILFSLWWLIPDQLRWPYNLFSNFR
nr:vegetative cell wall protein gp1-like [Lolium perenne]